jgi:hypothetical protein
MRRCRRCNRKSTRYILVPRLCLGTQCSRGSASQKCDKTNSSQISKEAEPPRQCVPRRSLGTSIPRKSTRSRGNLLLFADWRIITKEMSVAMNQQEFNHPIPGTPMRMANRFIPKVLIWLAVALMPWDMSFAFGCPCGDTSSAAASKGCCCESSDCPCCRAKKAAKRSCCQGKKAASQSSSHSDGASSITCTCRSKNQPQPQNPTNDSRNLKEQLGATPSIAIHAAGIPPIDTTGPFAADFPSYPLSALQRCGALCRFLI